MELQAHKEFCSHRLAYGSSGSSEKSGLVYPCFPVFKLGQKEFKVI